MYTCPVCGFDRLEDPPNNYTICPSCGTEFENDDVRMTREQLRRSWIDSGHTWWSTSEQPPDDWNPKRQLEELLHPEIRFVIPNLAPREMQIIAAAMGIGGNQSAGWWPARISGHQSNAPVPDVLVDRSQRRKGPGVLKEAWI
jgi:hypothetical protein